VKHRLIALAQLALGAGLLALLFARMENPDDLIAAVTTIAGRWWFLAGALLLALNCLVICTVRWDSILRMHGIDLPFLTVIKLYFIGHFFNAFMFGAVGGDLVKAVYVARAVPDRRTEAVSTIFIDRMIGMLALIALVTVVMSLRYRFFLRYPDTRVVMIFMLAVLLAAVAGLSAVFGRNLLERVALFRRLESDTALGAIIAKVYAAFHTCLNHRALMRRTLLLSFANHLSLVAAAFLLGLGLGIRTVHTESPARLLREAGNYMTVFPIVNGVATIPATPGGLGTRDVATRFLLGVPEFDVPAERSVPLSLLLYGIMLVWSLAGGLLYLLYVAEAGRITRAELQALEQER